MAKMSIRCRGRPAMARQKEKFSLPQAVLSQRNMRLSFIYVTRGFDQCLRTGTFPLLSF